MEAHDHAARAARAAGGVVGGTDRRAHDAGRSRARHVPAIILVPALLACLYGWAVFATSFAWPGAIGPNYNTPGTDYMVFHGGIQTALRGDWPLLFDADRFTNFLNAHYRARLSAPLTYRPFVYPPSFLLLLLPFSWAGFLTSYALFEASTAACLAAALCVRAARAWPAIALTAAALASPAASVNMLWGQGAFLTAAVLIGGTRLLERRPFLGGLVLGLLSVKPQHALLVPVILLACRTWPAIAAAAVSALGLALASLLIFGTAPWLLWAGASVHMAANVPLWDNSVHTCAILLGAGPVLANMLMAAASLGGALAVYVAFRSSRPPAIRLAILLAASNIAAPHTGPYDTLLLVIAAGIALINAQKTQELLPWILGLAVWLLPLFGQPVISPIARFAPGLSVLLIIFLLREGYGQKRLRRSALGGPAQAPARPRPRTPHHLL